MSSEPIRDPAKDYLLTPKNSALVIIDYQPVQVNSIKSMDHQVLVDDIVTVAKTGIAFGLPIVLSTVNVETGVNKPTIQPLLDALGNVKVYDRTTINAWEDVEFRDAHLTALRRVEQAGAQLISIPQLLCELQRDWARKDTVPAFVKLLFK